MGGLKISCVLTSYNRPMFVRQALRSVEAQTYRNFELIVLDESDPEILDILEAVSSLKMPLVKINVSEVSPEERSKTNRLGISINRGLMMAEGDLICYLADDDFLFPTWFEEAVKFFEAHPEVQNGFGSLHYTSCREMRFDQTTGVRFFDSPVSDPFGKLDHNQVMHRKGRTLWPTGPETIKEPDGHFFRELSKNGPFHPIPGAAATVKRLHEKCLQKSLGTALDGIRE